MGAGNQRCQSCGMPLKSDPKGGGTNADGSKSAVYCSYCYADGAFLDSFTEVKPYQAFVRQKMREAGWSRVTAWLLTLDIPRLGRWRKK